MGSGRASAALGPAGHWPRREVIWKENTLLNRTAQDDLFLYFMGACLDSPCRTLQLPSLFSILGLWSHKPWWNFGWKY